MPTTTDWLGITLPTPDDVSNEDEGEWAKILNNDTFDGGLDEAVIKRGTLSDRPAADSSKNTNLRRMFLRTDKDNPRLSYDRSTGWVDIAAKSADKDQFAHNRRTFQIDSSGAATGDRIKIGKISSGSGSESGSFRAAIVNASETDESEMSMVEMGCGVGSSAYTIQHKESGPQPADDASTVGLVVTETSGTGANSNNEYYLYANPAANTDAVLVVEHTNTFGSFNYTPGLTTADYTGSVVYDTIANAPSTDERTGSVTASTTVNTPELSGGVTDGTAIDSLVGNNLSVSGGALTASETTTLFMSDYAPSGGVVDTEFDSAIADATAGDRIVFDHNSYELNTSHTISKTLTIDATDDSVVSCTNTANNNPHIHFQGPGIVNNTTTAAVAEQGDRTISVNDTTIFSAGDRVLLMVSQHAAQVDTKIHFDIVESTDSTNGNISLLGGVYRDFASGSYVYQVDLLDSPAIKNISTDGGGTRHLQFQWCEDPSFENVSISQYLETSLYALECWKPRYKDVQATDPEGLASGEGEPIAIYRSTDGYVEAPRVYDCRRGIDLAWGAHTHAIVDPVIRGVSLNGISVHQDNQSGSLMITGGEIVCDPNGQSGAGITGSSTTKLYVDGIRIVARENGIICTGQSRITNVTVTPVEGVTAPQIAGFNIKYGDTSVRDSYVDDPDGLFDFPVWVDGGGSSNTKNIVIDVETAYRGSNHVYLDARNGGISNVRIRGFLRNLTGTADQAIFVRADGTSTIDRVDINVKATQLPNQGVRVLSGGTEQVTNLTFHDCYFDTGAAAIYTDGTGSFGSIRVSDCNCDTGTTSLSFNETVNKLFVTNNDVSGSIDHTGGTNKTISGNL